MIQATVSELIKELSESVEVPKNIQLSPLACGSLASIFDDQCSKIISESVYSGIDTDPEKSVLKGLVEFVERRAFIEGRFAGFPACQTERSDGFAAYPKRMHADAESVARDNALAEAIERFAWATWWDDLSIGHELREVNLLDLLPGETALRDVERAVPVSSVFEVCPKIENSKYVLRIYFAFLEGGGVTSGGACGSACDQEKTRYRALGELLRHALALRKMNIERILPESFYERRLGYFGKTQSGSDSVRERIAVQGSTAVTLPNLRFDSEVPHSLSKLVTVHRCYFEGQPPFVGGNLERMCL